MIGDDKMWVVISISIIIVLTLVLVLLTNIKDDNNYGEHHKKQITKFDKQEQETFGKEGELSVAAMLNDIISKHYGYVFNDFTFMDENGYSTNIDHIIICEGGIFIIETKSLKGIIYGNDNNEVWYQEKWQENKEFYNPVNQNQGHINHLKRMMGYNPPKLISMIIFSLADSIDNIDSKYVYDINSAYNYIVECINKNNYPKYLIDKTYAQLNQIINQYGISINEHKENIKNKYN